MNKELVLLIIRLVEVVLNAINIKRKKNASDDPATTLSNDGDVVQSKLTFSDLADKSKSN